MKNKNIKATAITLAILAPIVWLILHPLIGAIVMTSFLFLVLAYLIWCLVYAILDGQMP